jgi:DNA-binding MarR family transcriptional regulator
MDNQEIRTLKIFEKIEMDHAPSQRDLAKELNISLGLVNSFIKRLVRKGYFKITNIPANRVKYILTPKGAAEKTRLTYEYVKYSFDFYKTARLKLSKLFHNLEDQGVQKIIFYGANELTEIAFLALQETSISLMAIIDEENIVGKNILSFETINTYELSEMQYDKILLTIIGPVEEAVRKLKQTCIEQKDIVILK